MLTCTICGVRVMRAGPVLLHVRGGSFRWSATPVGHDASDDPRFLLVRLRWS